MFPNKSTTLKCSNCQTTNTILYTHCKSCSTIIKKKNTNDFNQSSKVTSRIDIFNQLQTSLDKVVETINILPESIITYANKFRTIFLLISMAKNDCQTCMSLLDLLVGYILNPNEELMNTICQKIQEIQEHLTAYEQEYYPQQNIHQIQSQLLNLQITRQPNINQVNQVNQQNNNNHNHPYEIPTYANNQPATIDQISLIKVVANDKIPSNNDDVCSICFDKLVKTNNIVIILPCGHFYHNDCIMEWLKVGNKCPLGRCPIIPLKDLIK